MTHGHQLPVGQAPATDPDLGMVHASMDDYLAVERRTAARWSTTSICPRQAVYAATIDADREVTDREQRFFWRGWTVGRDYADALAASLGCDHCRTIVQLGNRTANHDECPIIREKAVAWPAGVLHTDIYIKATRTPVEVLSSISPTEQQIHRKLLQLGGQIHFDPDVIGDFGVLVIVNPSDYSEEKIRFRLDDDWRQRVERAAGQVVVGLTTGELPDRVCRHPADTLTRFCRYAETCFADWQPPQLTSLEGDQIGARALELQTLKDERAAVRRTDKQLEADQRHVEHELAEQVPVGEWVVDGLRVTRARRSRESFGKKQAHAAGIPEHVIREHTTVSEWDEWKIEEVLP